MADFILVAETLEEEVRYLNTTKGSVTYGAGEESYFLGDFPKEDVRRCRGLKEFVLDVVDSGPFYANIWIDGKCYTRCMEGLLTG